MITRLDVLNAIAKKIEAKRYLEIGVRYGESIDGVNCPMKVGVDPKRTPGVTDVTTSDEFFESNKETWDLIFIDGLHEEEQVLKDMTTAVERLSPGGMVAAHDVSPDSHAHQRRGLCGTTWRGWVRMRATRPDLEMLVVDADHGVGVMRKGKQDLIELPDGFTYEEFAMNRGAWLNLKTWDEFEAWLGKG